MLDPSQYGLDPSVVAYLQGQPLQASATDPMLPSVGADIVAHPPPPPPPPPPQPQKITVVDPSAPIIGAIGAHVPTPPPPPPPPPQKIGEMPDYGLPAPILAGVKNGFAPQPAPEVPALTGLPQAVQQPETTAAKPMRPDVVAPVDVPTEQQVNATNKQIAQQQVYAASPDGLAEKADAEARGALAQEQQANQDASTAEQAQNTATANALQAHAQRVSDQEKIDAAKQAEDAANVQKYTQQYAQQVQDAANYKVDTNRDVGVGGLIAIALSGIGNALDHYHGPNQAAQMIENGIQQRIADQWRNKDALEKKASGTASVINQFRQVADDDRQAQQLHTAAELQKTADQVRLIGAQYANPAAKARTEDVAAQIAGKAAAITQGEAVRKAQALRDAQDERDKQAQIGLGYAGLAEKRREFDAQLQAQKDALNAAGKGQQAQALQAKADQVQQEGIFDPRSGDGLLDPQGRAKMQQADQLEAQARQQKDPNQAAQMRQQAQQLRADAQLNNVYTVKDPKTRQDIKNNIGANQELVDTINDIKQKLASDPNLADRSTWAAIKSKWEAAKKDYLKAAGNTDLSSRSMEAVDDALGPDPDSVISREFSMSKMNAALDSMTSSAIEDATSTLRRNGIKDTWQPKGLSPQDVTLGGKTAVERGADAELPAFLRPLSFSSNAERERQAENAAPLTQTGLAPQDEASVQSLVAKAGTANDAEYNGIVSQLANYAVSPRVGGGVLSLVRNDPALYRDVLSRMPPDRAKQLRQIDDAARLVDLVNGLGRNIGVR